MHGTVLQSNALGQKKIVEDLNRGASPVISEVYEVCHGKDQRVCTLHPHLRFESCNSGNEVTGTYPIATSLYLCGVGSHGQPRNFRVESTYPGVSGGHCGYAWFELRAASASSSGVLRPRKAPLPHRFAPDPMHRRFYPMRATQLGLFSVSLGAHPDR
jgi:hypothetical protein